MKTIQLTQGKVALVDDADFELINQHKWHYMARGYAARSVRAPEKKMLYMHRVVAGAPDGVAIDHINRNQLDNRRSNLRFASDGQNMANAKRRLDNKSGFKGVSWNKRAKKWQAYVNHNGQRVYLGLFMAADDAARAYDAKAVELFGQFANTNYPVAQ